MSDMVAYINIIQFFNDNVNKNSAKKHEKRSNLLTAAFAVLRKSNSFKTDFL